MPILPSTSNGDMGQLTDRGWLGTLQDNSADTDGDGMSDLYEVANGLDIHNAADAVDARIGYLNNRGSQ